MFEIAKPAFVKEDKDGNYHTVRQTKLAVPGLFAVVAWYHMPCLGFVEFNAKIINQTENLGKFIDRNHGVCF